MTMKLWHYFINEFLTKTKTNFRKAVKLSNYSDAVLNILRTIHPELEPIYHAVCMLCMLYQSISMLSGKTTLMHKKTKQKFWMIYSKAIPQYCEYWDTPIRTALTYGSDAYELVLFMDGRKPFTRGTIQQQVMAYQKLAKISHTSCIGGCNSRGSSGTIRLQMPPAIYKKEQKHWSKQTVDI